MTNLGSFADLANTKVGEVEPPKLIPTGHYEALFTKPAAETKSRQKGTLGAKFPLKLVAPTDDVDQEALAAMGGLPDKEYDFTFWLTPDSLFRLTDFGKAMGHSDELNVVELLEALGTSGDTFLVEVKHETDSRDPNKVFLRLDNPTAMAS